MSPPFACNASPLVSIIIPIYNHESYVEKRMHSILQQRIKDIEVILLDDASSDQSLNIARHALRDTDYRELLSSANSGLLFKQWDKGVHAATGKYIWIAESDDECCSSFLENLIPLMERNNAVLGYCESCLIDSAGNVLGDTYHYSANLDHWMSRSDFCWQGISFVANYLAVQCIMPNASGVVFRRDCYEFGLAQRFGLKLSGDWLQWIAIASKGPVVHSGQTLNLFRQHPCSVRSRTRHLVKHEALVCTRYAISMLSGAERPAFRRQIGFRLRSRWIFEMPRMLITEPKLYWQRAQVLSNLFQVPVLSFAVFDLIRLAIKPINLLIRGLKSIGT